MFPNPKTVPPSVPAHPSRALPLSTIRVVLVEPQGPRNVGSVARAMRNFGLQKLVLVGGVSPHGPEAREMAVHAADILAASEQVSDLTEALRDQTFVVGSTAKRRERCATLTPREAAPRILEEASRGQVALLFGREDHGLNGDELARAHLVLSIETAPECRALNLAQAVLLLAYELFMASTETGQVAHSDPGPLVSDDLLMRLQSELLSAMGLLGILNSGNGPPIADSINRILRLGPMQTRDARILFTLARRILETES